MSTRRLKILTFLTCLTCFNLLAMPKITTRYGVTKEGFVQIKIKNETRENLSCYVAIDGRKMKFKLTSQASSKWYQATDIRFKYTDFSVWCVLSAYVK